MVAIVQKKQASSAFPTMVSPIALTLDSPPTAGNYMLAAVIPASANTTFPAGWTVIFNGTSFGSNLTLAIKIATIGESSTVSVSFAPTVPDKNWLGVVEVDGPYGSMVHAVLTNATQPFPSITPPAGIASLIIGVNNAFQGQSITSQPTGYTAELDAAPNTGSNSERCSLWSRAVASPSGAYTGTTVYAASVFTTSVQVLFSDSPPTPGTSIDFDDDGFNVGPYDDVTADVMSWTITRGASAEITGGAQPGGATLVLRRRERDGLYNPWDVSSPLFGKLRDGKRVHIAVNNDGTLSPPGTVRGLFAGRITDITPLQSAGPDPVPITEIVCEDPLAWYGRTNVNIPDSRTRSHRALRLAVLSDIGETRYDLDNEIGTMPLSSAEGDAFGVLQRINAANGTRHFAKPSNGFSQWYRYTTYNRQHKLAGVADASLDAGSDHATDTSGWRLSADTVINRQTATVEQVRFPDRKITVWQPDALPITVTTTLQTIWATFDDYVDGAELDYSKTGSALTVTFTSFGRTAKITLVSAGTSKVTRLLVVGHLVERGTAVSVVIDDTASQAGPRGVRAGQDISGDYVGVRAMADGIARHLVWRYGNPQMRPTLTVQNWFPEQFELDLYDLIAFTADQFAAAAVLFEIVGLTHNGDIASPAVQHHTTTYVLQECRVQTPTNWFVLDTSLLDGSHILAY